MPKIVDRVGEKYITNEGYEVEIIEYFRCNNCTIIFNKKKNKLFNKHYKHIKNGHIKNPFHPSVLGVGYLGEGLYTVLKNRVVCEKYIKWCSVLQRCYNEKTLENRPTYKDTIVCEEWHNFQNFAEWFEEDWKEWMDDKWELDKDILIKGNKIYSPETCCFVPVEINLVLTSSKAKRGELPIGVHKSKSGRYKSQIKSNGIVRYLGTFDTPEEAFQAYKTAKEQYIKEVADKWRGKITEQVYNTLINYKVEITD